MSFKLKTILLLISLSLTPYVITMLILANAYRSDVETQLRDDLRYNLDVMVERLDQNLLALEKDLRFIASLDIMNDVLTGDLDRRILNLLLLKKDDLALDGEIEVLDLEELVIASTNLDAIGQASRPGHFLEIPVFTTFSNSQLGSLRLFYAMDNLTRYFANDQHLQYLLETDDQTFPAVTPIGNPIRVQSELKQRPEITLVLEQDTSFAFAILDGFTRSFYIALVIGIMVIASIAFLAANYIVQPILLLSSTARLITRTHDYSKRVQVSRSDEIGKLAGAFNQMIEGMQDLIARLKEENEVKIKLAEERNRSEMLQGLSTKLSKYLSPQIYESIFSGEKDVTLGSSRKKLTIFFSDIVNFTGTTDEMESEDLTQLLNQYLNEMTNIALDYGATVDKYIGDAIMIFFGDPHSLGVKEDAQRCVAMALAMRQRVADLQQEWHDAGFTKPFNIRVGIHTGYCTVGNFGTESRMDYTIVGSAVNLASRIESSAESGQVCISEDTYLLIRDEFQCETANSLLPKGLTKAVQTFTVIDSSSYSAIVVNEPGLQMRIQPNAVNEMSREHLRRILESLDRASLESGVAEAPSKDDR